MAFSLIISSLAFAQTGDVIGDPNVVSGTEYGIYPDGTDVADNITACRTINNLY